MLNLTDMSSEEARSSRRRSWLLVALVALTGVAAFLWWGLRDASAVDDAAFLPLTGTASSPSAAYAQLRELARESEQLQLSGRRVADLLRREDVSVPANQAAEVRALRLVHDLPARINQVLSASELHTGSGAEQAWSGVITIARLVRLRVEQDLLTANPDEAVLALRAGLRLSARLHDDAQSLAQLATASRVHEVLTHAFLEGLSSGRWRTDDLRMLLDVKPPARSAASALAAVRASYADLLQQAAEAAEESLLPRYAYHQNRSRTWWSNATGRAVRNLQHGDVVRAYDSLLNLPALEAVLGRNAVGAQLFPLAASALARDVAWTLELPARFQQLRLACALAIYQREHHRHAGSLSELVPAILSSIPEDPWSGQSFRYVATEDLVYSVGPNRNDEGGQYDSTAAKAGRSDDFGMRVTQGLSPNRNTGE